MGRPGVQWRVLQGGGVLICTDIFDKPAFDTYCLHVDCVACKPTPLPVRYAILVRISHTSRRAPLQPVSNTQVPCTPYHPPNIAGVYREVSEADNASLPVRHAVHTQR